MRRVRIGCVPVLLLAFVLAELLRGTDIVQATVLSMVGWSAFAILFVSWWWEDCGVRAGLRSLGRLALLAGIAFAVLYLFYRHAHLVEAGMEVDATYTFMGLGWFTTVENAITYAGQTPSFAQFPMALLGHLPGYLVGFDVLGPFAIHVSLMLQTAVLLAVLTTFVVEARLPVQAATVALLAAVFSTRLTMLLWNLTGYAIPAISVGLIFLVTVLGEQSSRVMFPRVGGLLMFALLQHYPGVFFLLPLVGLWVVAGRDPRGRLVEFLRANAPLCAAVPASMCPETWPEVLGWRPPGRAGGTTLYLFGAACGRDVVWSATTPQVLELP